MGVVGMGRQDTRMRMCRFAMLAALLAAGGALGAHAEDAVDWPSHAKSVRAAATQKGLQAPFTRAVRDPLPELMLREEQERRGPRGACEHAATDVCYDIADGRVVYRPARKFMPRLDGFNAESISLRRDRILFKYSFR